MSRCRMHGRDAGDSDGRIVESTNALLPVASHTVILGSCRIVLRTQTWNGGHEGKEDSGRPHN
jgi:hypothetical protein